VRSGSGHRGGDERALHRLLQVVIHLWMEHMQRGIERPRSAEDAVDAERYRLPVDGKGVQALVVNRVCRAQQQRMPHLGGRTIEATIKTRDIMLRLLKNYFEATHAA